MSYSWTLICLSFVLILVWKGSKIGSRPPGCPPGPPTLPLIGNLHQMPLKDGFRQFQKWAEEYGEIYSLVLGTTVMIVLSSDQAVKDLCDKRSGIYSSRPDLYMMGLLSGGDTRVTFMPYNDTWRLVRKVYHNTLNVKASASYAPYQDLESKHLLAGILEMPELFVDHIKRYTHSQTTQLVFGYRMTSIDDPRMKQFFQSFQEVVDAASNTAAVLFDLFPILRQLPDVLQPQAQRARALHQKEKEVYGGHWFTAKSKIQNGTSKPCFCVELVKAQQAEGFSDELAMYMSGVLLEGGTDTSVMQLHSFVLAMLLHPDAQKAAQQEIDRVCGDRLPTAEDEPSLPYVRACVKEAFRWLPVAVMGLPHSNTVEDEYKGYRIPKASTIVTNVWTIHQNPARFPDPSKFDPSRFVHDTQTAAEAATNPDVSRRDHFVFGTGRRLCPGIHIADRSMFLATSRLLWAFRFEPAESGDSGDGDGDGDQEEEEEVKEEDVVLPDPANVTQGSLIQPMPFPVRIVARSEDHARVVRREWEGCQAVLDGEGQWLDVPVEMRAQSQEA